jgi:hypothetical protein
MLVKYLQNSISPNGLKLSMQVILLCRNSTVQTIPKFDMVFKKYEFLKKSPLNLFLNLESALNLFLNV